jgi:hypothetical protein
MEVDGVRGLLINAPHSRRFVIMPTAPSWDAWERSTSQKASPYACEGAAQASHLFRMLDRLITTRLEPAAPRTRPSNARRCW